MNGFPNAYKTAYYVPEPTFMPRGDMEYDLAKVANYIVDIMDNCNGGVWSCLEADLGLGIFDVLSRELSTTDILEDEKTLRQGFYYNEDISGDIAEAFSLFISL